jgi:hypothetical protein
MSPIRCLILMAALAPVLAGCGVGSLGKSPNSGAGDDDSLYRAQNFATALKAVQDKVGPGGDLLELRIEARRATFTVRVGKTEKATGYRARAGHGGDLSSFDVDVVGQGSLQSSAIPISDVSASALTRMEAQALKRDPGAKLDTIQFFTLETDPGSRKPEWRFNVHGMLYLADLDGGTFHSPGEGAGTLADPELTPTERNALKLSHCVAQAGGDADKLQRCQKKYLKR